MAAAEEQNTERRGMKTSPIWIIIFVALALVSYFKGPKGVAQNPYRNLDDKAILSIVLLTEQGHDPWLDQKVTIPQEMVALVKNGQASPQERGATALRLALLKATVMEKEFAALAFDKKVDSYLRVACFYALALLEAEGHISALENVYWTEKDGALRKGVLFALHLYGEPGQMPIVDIVRRERKLERSKRFYDFDLKEKSSEFVNKLKKTTKETLEAKANAIFWYRLAAVPFVAGVGTLGAAYPPALFLLIIFVYFPLTGKMGAFLFLAFITLSNIDETLTVEAIAASICTLLVVFFADQSTFVVDVVILVLALIINFRYQLSNKITSMGETVVKLATVNADSIIADIGQGGAAREKAMVALVQRGPEFVDGLIAADIGDDLSRRATALQALGFVKDERCANHLIKALTYPESYLKGTAMFALARLAHQPAIPHLVQLADQREEPELRINALKAMAHYPIELVKPTLEKYTQDEDPKLRLMVVDFIKNPPQFAQVVIEETTEGAEEKQDAEE